MLVISNLKALGLQVKFFEPNRVSVNKLEHVQVLSICVQVVLLKYLTRMLDLTHSLAEAEFQVRTFLLVSEGHGGCIWCVFLYCANTVANLT